MSDTLRVGVVGTSWYADLMHLPNLKSHPQVEVYAICGRDRTRAEEMTAKYAIPHVFTDYHDLIAHGNLQALVIATPDDLHYPITMAALNAGLHVLCEKPLALNAGQAKAMFERAEAIAVKHMVFFTFRWVPVFRYVRQLLDQGYIGRCFHCYMRYVGDYGRDGQYGWRFDQDRSNGILGDLGVHLIDLARWYVGDISKVCGHLTTFIDRSGPNGQRLNPANDAALVAVQFANGAQGIIQVSAVAQVGEEGLEQQLVLHGEDGTLEVNFTFGDTQIRGVRRSEKEFQVLTVPDELWRDVNQHTFLDPFITQSVGTRLFVDAILMDRPLTPTFSEGYQAQLVIDAVIESHKRGQWITIT